MMDFLYDHLYHPVSDEDFKLFHAVDRRLYAKLINILGRDPAESMKVMAFLQWLERVGKDLSFLRKLYIVPLPLLNEVAEEALTCLKCAEVDKFTENSSCMICFIPNLLNHKFTLKYIHENRESAIRGVTDFLKRVCLRAFDDIVQQPKYFTRGPTPNISESMNKDEIGSSSGDRRVPKINNPSHHVPSGGGGGGIFIESMIPSENKIEEIGSLNSSRMTSIINPAIHVVSGGGGGTSNIEEIGRVATRMVPMNPSNVPGAGDGICLGLPYFVPNQMQYMPPFLGGSAMNLLTPPTPYGLFSPVSGSGVFHPISQLLPPPPLNYHKPPPAMHKDIAELLKNSLNINIVEEEKEVPPDDRTVFLTFSKGYPITEDEVREFFTRKIGKDVEAVYMQEVTEDEQPLYARLVTRTPAAFKTIVESGRSKYNINGKHVWARKYVKKLNSKNQFELYEGHTSSPVAACTLD